MLIGQKILVTGATGFVGQHVCALLERQGAQLVKTSRTSVNAGSAPDLFQVPALGPNTDWSEALQGCSIVVHLAARVHVMDDQAADPLHAFRLANTEGTLQLARQAAECGVKRLVFVSSIKVNGEAGDFTADSQPQPIDPYGISKHEAEQQLFAFSRASGLEVSVLRPPLVYGPGVRANFLKLFGAVAKGIPLPFGLVNNKRSLVYVGNLASAIASCAVHPNAAGNVFLVSDNADVSTAQLVREMAQALGRHSSVLPALLSVPPRFIEWAAGLLGKRAAAQRLLGNLTVSPQALRSQLGWEPPYSLQVGMKETAAWYQGHNNTCCKKVEAHHEHKLSIKRMFDLLLGLAALVILALPLVLVAVAVRLTSKGPALYWSDRVGINNHIFKMPKFRSMRVGTPAVATHLLSNAQSHLTPIGSFIRKTSLDELPQLWSILKGDMSFVGPRPALFNQDDLVAMRTEKGIHTLVPGLTGWAQVNGRDDIPTAQKVQRDFEYLQKRSLMFDIHILWLTFLKVVKRDGVSH